MFAEHQCSKRAQKELPRMSFERLLSPPEGLELLAAEDRSNMGVSENRGYLILGSL